MKNRTGDVDLLGRVGDNWIIGGCDWNRVGLGFGKLCCNMFMGVALFSGFGGSKQLRGRIG